MAALTETEKKQVLIYSSGICYCSVCSPKKMSRAKVTRVVNATHPSGVGPWKISGDSKFRTGQPNPCQCDDSDDRHHVLFEC